MAADAPRYYRLSPKFWSDPMVLAWDDDTRLVALYLLTCPHRTTEGLFRLPRLYAVADLGWTAERFDQAFQNLLRDGFAEWDESAQVVLIVKALVWQSPDNGNMVKSAVRQLAMVPETPLKARFRALAERYCERLAEGLPEGFGKVFGNPQALSLPPSPTPEDLAASAAVDVGAEHPMPVKGPDLARHLTSWAVGEGIERPDDRRPTPHVRWLLELVDQWLGTGTHSHGARMALLGEWCVLAGSEPPESEAWGHLARLVKNYGGIPTLEAMHEATTNGAGLDEQWRDDPRALTKYATSVLKSREEAA